MTTAALILAAGLARRFGGGKMLAEVNGRPMLEHVVELARTAELAPIVVVTGDETDALALDGAIRISNPDPARGLSSSFHLGLGAVPESDRVIVLLGDQPLLTHDQLTRILAAPRDPERPIVVPRFGGVPGNPVLLEREAFPLAANLTGDRGMSQLFASHPDLVRYVDVPGTNPDIDTPDDLARISRGGG